MFMPIWSVCLLLLIVLAVNAKRRRYFCDTWEDAVQASVFGKYHHRYPSAIGLFFRFRRIVGHENEIYFIFNNRTFYTEFIQVGGFVG